VKSIIRKIIEFFLPFYLINSGKINKVINKATEGKIILSVFFHNPSKELFESIVKWFLDHGFKFISADELYEIGIEKKTFPSKAVIFTVDDGWKENKENLVAIANKYNIPVSIFINTDPIENGKGYWVSYLKHSQQKLGTSHTVGSIKKLPDTQRKKIVSQLVSSIELPREAMTIEELRSIKNGNISLGAHTLSHPFLVNCTKEDSKNEISGSKEKLENWLGTKVDTFAYPFGSFGEREIEYVKSAGYKMAFSTVADYITQENIGALYKLPRFEVIEHASLKENICRMTGVWDETINLMKKNR